MIKIPDAIQGETLEERRAAYIDVMQQILRDGFAMAVLHYNLNQDDEVNSVYMDRFF